MVASWSTGLFAAGEAPSIGVESVRKDVARDKGVSFARVKEILSRRRERREERAVKLQNRTGISGINRRESDDLLAEKGLFDAKKARSSIDAYDKESGIKKQNMGEEAGAVGKSRSRRLKLDRLLGLRDSSRDAKEREAIRLSPDNEREFKKDGFFERDKDGNIKVSTDSDIREPRSREKIISDARDRGDLFEDDAKDRDRKVSVSEPENVRKATRGEIQRELLQLTAEEEREKNKSKRRRFRFDRASLKREKETAEEKEEKRLARKERRLEREERRAEKNTLDDGETPKDRSKNKMSLLEKFRSRKERSMSDDIKMPSESKKKSKVKSYFDNKAESARQRKAEKKSQLKKFKKSFLKRRPSR